MVLRGDSIYARSFMGYPPLGILLSAGAMALGAPLGVPSWIAPRCAGLLVAMLASALLYAIVRRATGKAWPGLLAAVALTGFSEYAALSLNSLEPKNLVALFSLLLGLALQRRAWGLAGLASGLAATCWQPAGLLVPAGLLAAGWGGRDRPARSLGAFAVGGLCGALPALGYLAWQDAWWDFWQRSVVIPSSHHLRDAAAEPMRWLGVARHRYPNEWLCFPLAGLGFGWFVAESLLAGPRRGARAWLASELGGAPLLTAVWIAFNSVDFQGAPDMLPILPWLAFWIGWGAQRAGSALAARFAWLGRGKPARLGVSAALLAAAAYGFTDAFLFRPALTLARQRELVRWITSAAAPQDTVVAFYVEEVYALEERRPPLPFLRLNESLTPFLELVEPGGCPALIRRVLDLRPAAVVSGSRYVLPVPSELVPESGGGFRQSECIGRLLTRLLKDGYTRTQVRVALRGHLTYASADRDVVVRRWNVYRRADAQHGEPPPPQSRARRSQALPRRPAQPPAGTRRAGLHQLGAPLASGSTRPRMPRSRNHWTVRASPLSIPTSGSKPNSRFAFPTSA